MTTRHVPLCQTKGCPTRRKGFKGDSNDWHVPWCGHGLEGHHHHVKKRSQGGTKGDIVFICPGCHRRIDEHHWGNAVLDIPGVGRVYRVWDQNNRTVFERIIEAAPLTEAEAPALARVWDNPEDAAAFGDEDEAEIPEPVEPPVTTATPGPMAIATIENPQGTPVFHSPRVGVPAVKKPAVQYLSTGLVLPESLSFDKWQELVGTLKGMIGGVPWWAGDLVNFGERKYGERYSQAMDELGLKYDRLANYAWVASKVEPSTRVENLSWSHHREVADLEPDEQRAWLQRAQDENLSANALRKAISGEEPELPCPESATGRHEYACKHCGKER